MGRKHVCNNGEAAHVYASQRAIASAIICLLCSFLIKALCQKMNGIVSPANANTEDYENRKGEGGKLNDIGLRSV